MTSITLPPAKPVHIPHVSNTGVSLAGTRVVSIGGLGTLALSYSISAAMAGAEVVLAGNAVQAAAESYVGLVEVGAGVIPAGGGCYFMLERVLEGIDEPVLSNLPFIRIAF